jgi:hypothetical protein
MPHHIRFTAEKETRYPLCRRIVEPQRLFGRVRKFAPQPGLDPRPVQPVASRTTQNKHKRHTSMLSAGFQLPDPSKELLHTSALDRKSTGIVNKINIYEDNECIKTLKWGYFGDSYRYISVPM